MIFFVVIAVFVTVASAQRGSFAGSRPIGVPDVASRFKTEANSVSSTNVQNRFDAPQGTTERLPVDANGDYELVKRIKTWPRENWPFWYINAGTIEQQRGTPNLSSANTDSQLNSRFGQDNGEPIQIQNKLFFNAIVNSQQKTYEYDPRTDAWYARKY